MVSSEQFPNLSGLEYPKLFFCFFVFCLYHMSKQRGEGSASHDPHSGPRIAEASPSYDAVAPRCVTTEEKK